MFKIDDETPEKRHWRCKGVSIVNFEHVLHITFSVALIFHFEQVNTGLACCKFSNYIFWHFCEDYVNY